GGWVIQSPSPGSPGPPHPVSASLPPPSPGRGGGGVAPILRSSKAPRTKKAPPFPAGPLLFKRLRRSGGGFVLGGQLGLVGGHAGGDQLGGFARVAPAVDLDRLALLQILVAGEEVLDLLDQDGGQLTIAGNL